MTVHGYRRSVRDGVASCSRLAAMPDRDLELYLVQTSEVGHVLDDDPRIGWGFAE
ncbi:hypothetical protein nbrc107696_20370 [Gordonia spumicola]|uniref:Uncharacterized protein n=1 Tax=Gordonia spumicola TaxID=589161 RepID=A0A7I9V8Z8_9ACTN|nr:hypothetical protein [Gordonia spumicola]GEE01591.1 hypothetical protein nbrc107696_20370 [Gordonia spumicola]